MGFISGVVLGTLVGLALMVAFVYFENKRSRERRQLAVYIAGLSRLTLDDTKRMIPKNFFPPWVVFSSQQKVNWLNQELVRVWPYVDKATAALVKEKVEPILEQYRPSVIDSLKFQKFTLGTIAPQFIGIEMVEDGENELTMKVELQWDGNPSIILGVKTMVGVSLPVQVKNVALTGVFGFMFKPFVDSIPGFGAVTYTLHDLKKFDFVLKAIGGNMNYVPGLAGIIEGLIRTAVTDPLLWPMRHVIPIVPGDYSDLELQVIGILEVKLVRAKGLLNKDVVGKSDPFAVLFIRPIPNRIKKTRTIDNDLNPIWNEHFKFEVEDLKTQKLTIQVFDEEGVQSSELLGCTEVELKNLGPGKLVDLWLPLVKDLGMYQQNSSKYRGEVQVELLYYSLDEDTKGLDASLKKPSLALTSLEKVISTSTSGPKHTSSSNLWRNFKKIKEGGIIRGVLSVTVIRAENLTATDFNNTSDPYVVLKTKKTDVKKMTRVIPKTLNPVWNQPFDIMVEDALHELLIIEVWDHNAFIEKSMGKSALTLTKVLYEGEYDVDIQLDGVKNGTLFLHLKWIQPLPPDIQYLNGTN